MEKKFSVRMGYFCLHVMNNSYGDKKWITKQVLSSKNIEFPFISDYTEIGSLNKI